MYELQKMSRIKAKAFFSCLEFILTEYAVRKYCSSILCKETEESDAQRLLRFSP